MDTQSTPARGMARAIEIAEQQMAQEQQNMIGGGQRVVEAFDKLLARLRVAVAQEPEMSSLRALTNAQGLLPPLEPGFDSAGHLLEVSIPASDWMARHPELLEQVLEGRPEFAEQLRAEPLTESLREILYTEMDFEVRARRQARRLAAAQQVLRKVEWIEDPTSSHPLEFCPACLADKADGHESTCPLRDVLQELAEEPALGLLGASLYQTDHVPPALQVYLFTVDPEAVVELVDTLDRTEVALDNVENQLALALGAEWEEKHDTAAAAVRYLFELLRAASQNADRAERRAAAAGAGEASGACTLCRRNPARFRMQILNVGEPEELARICFKCRNMLEQRWAAPRDPDGELVRELAEVQPAGGVVLCANGETGALYEPDSHPDDLDKPMKPGLLVYTHDDLGIGLAHLVSCELVRAKVSPIGVVAGSIVWANYNEDGEAALVVRGVRR